MNLDYYAQHGAALFPLPAGSKAPGNAAFWANPENPERAGSFLHHCSRDPLQWAAWINERPGCNFGVVGYASNWIIVDIDTKGEDKATAQAEAWQAWADLCAAWGFAEPFAPHVMSARGGWHVYFSIPEGIDAATLRQPDAIKKRINVRVRGYTVTAGSYYDGSTATPSEESGHYQLYGGAPYPAPAPLLEHCAPPKPRENVSKIGTHDFGDTKRLYEWLGDTKSITTDEEWRNAGMAAKLEFGDNGFELWNTLAQKLFNESVDAQNETRWRSFGTEATNNAVTMDSIFKLAHGAGWKGTVRPSAQSMFGGVVASMSSASAPGPSIDYDMASLPLPQSQDDEEHTDFPTPEGGFAKPSSGFLGAFTPPDYLMDGVMQRRFCYTMTAQTGVGKTTIAMRIAAHVALGIPLGSINIEPGNVMYFAGENPTDIQMRWLGLTRELNIDPASVDNSLFFVPGVLHFSKVYNRLREEITRKNINPSLIIVDTAAAYFEGDNDNDNIQAGNHARMLRALCDLPGGPCVLVLAHPTKGAKTIEEMTPRGGGAFLNEVDGNIGLVRNESGAIVAAAIGKFRGPEFTPMHFALKVIKDHPLLVDTKGRQIPTIIAEPISAGEVQRREERASTDDDKVLKVLADNTMMRNAAVQKAMGWKFPEQSRRVLKRLADEGLATETKDYWAATPKGQKYLNGLELAEQVRERPEPITPANLGPAGFPLPAGPLPPMPPQ